MQPSLPRVLAVQIAQHVGTQIRLQGWLHQVRALGEVNFVILRDRSGLVQAVLTHEELHPLAEVGVESIIELTGTVVAEAQAPGGHELHEVTITVLEAIHEAPPLEVNKKHLKASLPVFLEHAVIGHRHLEQRAILRISAGVMQGFRQVLDELGFTEIQSPKLVGAAAEGGANVYEIEHFGKKAYLAQSPQLYKQIMVGVFERVYEIGPVFRAEKHSTSRHTNEYVSLDMEMGFIDDHFDVMAMLSRIVDSILVHLQTNSAAELALLKVNLPQYTLHPEKCTFPYIDFVEAQELITKLYGVNDAIGAPDLTPEHERLLGRWALETHGTDFLFVVGYPTKKRAFYTAPNPDNPTYSNSFDLLFRGTELVSGAQRLHRYEDYLKVMQERGYVEESFTEYLKAFRYGMPKHGGFGLGLERFVMQLLQLENIRQATLFPRDIHRLTP